METNYCSSCGAEVDSNSSFCAACGAPLGGSDGSGRATGQGDQFSSRQESRSGPREGRRSREAPRQSPPPGENPQANQGRRAGQPQAESESDGPSRRGLLAAGASLVALAGVGAFVFMGGDSGSDTLGGSSEPPLDEMQVRMVDVRQPNAGLTSATLPLIVAFENPASEAIPDISGDLDVNVNGNRVGSEEITVNRLEPSEETNVNLDVIVEYADVGDAVVEAIREGSLTASLTGELNAGSATRSVSVSGQL